MMNTIPFFKTAITGHESQYVQQVLSNGESFAQKIFVEKCEKWFAEHHQIPNFYLTKSCSHSLELAFLMLGIGKGDEVIMPSYGFVSCANAVALRGGTCVFVDIHASNMNIDETKIEAAVTPNTKAIVTINYAGVACNYEKILTVARNHKLWVIEDNAHGIGGGINNQKLGTFGDIATFSFDHLKNISCGQGGGIAINNQTLLNGFFVPYEFGTNRRSYFKGEADRYEWKNIGSNFQLSELNAAMLYAQLEDSKLINNQFLKLWNLYFELLSTLSNKGKIRLPQIPEHIYHNAHCFFIKTKSETERNLLVSHLKEQGIQAQFHYTPLHISEFGKRVGYFSGEDVNTTSESKKLLRLPLFYNLSEEEVRTVATCVINFYTELNN